MKRQMTFQTSSFVSSISSSFFFQWDNKTMGRDRRDVVLTRLKFSRNCVFIKKKVQIKSGWPILIFLLPISEEEHSNQIKLLKKQILRFTNIFMSCPKFNPFYSIIKLRALTSNQANRGKKSWLKNSICQQIEFQMCQSRLDMATQGLPSAYVCLFFTSPDVSMLSDSSPNYILSI